MEETGPSDPTAGLDSRIKCIVTACQLVIQRCAEGARPLADLATLLGHVRQLLRENEQCGADFNSPVEQLRSDEQQLARIWAAWNHSSNSDGVSGADTKAAIVQLLQHLRGVHRHRATSTKNSATSVVVFLRVGLHTRRCLLPMCGQELTTLSALFSRTFPDQSQLWTNFALAKRDTEFGVEYDDPVDGTIPLQSLQHGGVFSARPASGPPPPPIAVSQSRATLHCALAVKLQQSRSLRADLAVTRQSIAEWRQFIDARIRDLKQCMAALPAPLSQPQSRSAGCGHDSDSRRDTDLLNVDFAREQSEHEQSMADLAAQLSQLAEHAELLLHDLVARSAMPTAALLAQTVHEARTIRQQYASQIVVAEASRSRWKCIWESELGRIVGEQAAVQQRTANIHAALAACDAVESTVQQLQRSATTGFRRREVVIPPAGSGCYASDTMVAVMQELEVTAAVAESDQILAPRDQASIDSIDGALTQSPTSARRIQAMAKHERLRRRELECRLREDNAFARELVTFVESRGLRDTLAGGVSLAVSGGAVLGSGGLVAAAGGEPRRPS